MPSLGPAEILVILVVALLVFGPNKMPDIARQVGRGMREFKRVQQHLKSELRDVVSEFDAPSSTTPAVEIDPVPMLPPKDDTAAPTTDSAGAPPAGAPGRDAGTGSPPDPGPPADPA
jgi:sec-independent protein translocase protein TatA